MLTKFGEKGAINLSKMLPAVGGVIGGSIDAVTTKIIAKNAKRVFILDEIEQENDTIIDVTVEEIK